MDFQWFLGKFEDFVGVNLWTMLFAWLNLLILYWIDEPLEHMTLKTNRKYAQENYRTAGNRKPTLKGFTSRLVQTQTSAKTPV